jgi:hypothetical protein
MGVDGGQKGREAIEESFFTKYTYVMAKAGMEVI